MRAGMKKYALIVILTLLCTYIYAEEITQIRLYLNSPREIRSNEKKTGELEISNEGNIVLHDLELTVLSGDILEVNLDRTRIDTIKPNERIFINMEIINNHRYYFSKDAFITLKISNDEITKENRYKFTIEPVKNFWFSIIMLIALITIISFIVIFIKINKGEENAG
jgi:uncharacterized membrane protein